MAQEAFQLKELEAVSPTLAEALRVCKLRAGLSRTENVNQYIMGNPKAWLGTAYHAVLEAVGSCHSEDIEAQVPGLWVTAIQKEYNRTSTHPWNKRFGPPESWPGYHIVASMAVIRAKELVKTGTYQRSGETYGVAACNSLYEKKFSGANGKIVGRPDVVRADEVLDFKSGEIFEYDGQEQIKGSYIRQLRIYGFLVRETLGWWPRRGVLLPMIGSPVEVDLKADECKKEAEDAVRLLEEYNAVIARRQDPVALASPSSTSCRWCPFQLYCSAFWNAIEPKWIDDLCYGAIEGQAIGEASPIHNGLALSLSMNVDLGTVPANHQISLFPLDALVHPDVTQVRTGDRVRITGLFPRADNSLVATKRTMIALEGHLPRIEI